MTTEENISALRAILPEIEESQYLKKVREMLKMPAKRTTLASLGRLI